MILNQHATDFIKNWIALYSAEIYTVCLRLAKLKTLDQHYSLFVWIEFSFYQPTGQKNL